MTITREIPAETAATGDRDLWLSMKRGWRQTCPACGQGALYRAYLKVNDHCPHCHEALYHQRADDAPPYFTMIVTGHVVVGGILLLEQTVAPPTWVQQQGSTLTPCTGSNTVTLRPSNFTGFRVAYVDFRWHLGQ